MENLYAIHAYDLGFQGLHGFEDFEVIEAINDDEAIEYAEDMSRQVIEDYDLLTELGETWDDYDEYDELVNQDIAFEVYKITVDTNHSLVELNKELYNDPEEFFKKYNADLVA